MRRLSAAAALLALWSVPAAALQGRIVDSEGTPVAGGIACVMVNDAPGVCAEADASGRFEMMDTDQLRLRVSAPGFIARYVPAVTHEEPIALHRAASLRVRLVHAEDREPISAGKVTIIYPSGRQIGPFPVNASGLIVGQLPPGEVVVAASSPGFRSSPGTSATLIAGEQSSLTIDLQPEGGSPGADDPDS